MVGNWECAAPGFGRHRTTERLEQGLRVRIRDRQNRNLLERDGFFSSEPFRAGLGGPAGRQWIANIQRHVHHAAALYPERRTEGALWINVALEIAVIARIGVDQATHGASLIRDLGLGAAPALAVARDHDPAFDADTLLFEDFVVFRDAVVDVN